MSRVLLDHVRDQYGPVVTGVDGLGPGWRRWRWRHSVPLRWLLVDEYDGPDVAVALCADIEGLFVEPPPAPPTERYTLLDCEPAGRLRATLDGTADPWLGNIVLDAVHRAIGEAVNGPGG